MTDNITGKGLDVPLLGIRKAVEEIWASKKDGDNKDGGGASHLKALFKDPVFNFANQFKLSTSQVSKTIIGIENEVNKFHFAYPGKHSPQTICSLRYFWNFCRGLDTRGAWF